MKDKDACLTSSVMGKKGLLRELLLLSFSCLSDLASTGHYRNQVLPTIQWEHLPLPIREMGKCSSLGMPADTCRNRCITQE